MAESFSAAVMREKWLAVIRFLLNHRGNDFTQTELADQVDVSYKTVNTVVHTLEDFGVVEITDRGGMTLVELNTASPYVAVLEELADIDARPLRDAAREYAQTVMDAVDGVTGIVLFGSVARGWPTNESDIDVLVLVRDGDVEVVEDRCHAVADRFSRDKGVKVSPLVMAQNAFLAELVEGAPLENRIEEEGIILAGEVPW